MPTDGGSLKPFQHHLTYAPRTSSSLSGCAFLRSCLGACRRMTSGRSGFPIPCAWKIARTLYISEKAASVYVSNIMRKLGVTSRLQAATAAHSHPHPNT